MVQTLGPFVRSDVAEAGSDLMAVGSSTVEVVLTHAGALFGISVDLTAPLAAGSTYTVTACVNGAPAVGARAGEGTSSGSCFHSGVTVNARDCLTVRDTAEGGATGRGAAVVVWMQRVDGDGKADEYEG